MLVLKVENQLDHSLLYVNYFQNTFIEYAACLLFELWIVNEVPHLKIFYKKSSVTNEAIPLYIPNCGYTCALTDMYKLYENILPTEDYNTFCARIK